MGDYDGSGQTVSVGLLLQRLLEQVRIEVPGLAVAVDKDRGRAQVQNRIDPANKGQGGREDLISLSNTNQSQRQMKRRSPARNGNSGHAYAVLKGFFERRQVRPYG